MKAGTNLERAICEGKFVVTAELGPPMGASRKKVEEKIKPVLERIFKELTDMKFIEWK